MTTLQPTKRQPATVGAVELGWRVTTARQTTTRVVLTETKFSMAGWQLCGSPPDGASCSRRAGLQQCKSFVEMCIVSCLSASPACICGQVSSTWDFTHHPTSPTTTDCVGRLMAGRQQTAPPQHCCSKDTTAHPRFLSPAFTSA
jgi:hypothetical protein